MSIVQGTLPVGSLDHAITLNVQSSGGSHFETVTDTTPYLHRTSPQDVASSMKLKKVVGGTIAWHQMMPTTTSYTIQSGSADGLTISVANGYIDITGTATSNVTINVQPSSPLIPANHVCLMLCDGWSGFMWGRGGFPGKQRNYYLNKHTTDFWAGARIFIYSGDTPNIHARFSAYDLTQMFGSTIADYIYSLEQAHAGDGVAWFKALFGEDYYPYNAGELLSVKTSARKTYDADNVEIGSYPLDDNLTLRGIPKLDSNNELYYDGDTYASDGNVQRKYKEVTLNGDSTYTYQLNGQTASANNCYINFGDKAYGKNNFASDRFVIAGGADVSAGTMVGRANLSGVEFRLPTTVEYTQEAYKSWFASNPTTVVYELATPTTESADAYTQSQRVGATEEFVDGRTVEIPVGNVSEYKRLIQED